MLQCGDQGDVQGSRQTHLPVWKVDINRTTAGFGMSDDTSLLGARATDWAAEYSASLKEPWW